MDAFKERNNRIFSQNLSESDQNPARFFEKNTMAKSVKAVPGHVEERDKRVCSVLLAVSDYR